MFQLVRFTALFTASAIMVGGCARSDPSLSSKAQVRPSARSACDFVTLSPKDELVSIPFDVVDGRAFVRVRVNGSGPFVFAIDTGASGLARADSSLVKALALPITDTAQNSDGVTTAQADVTHFASLDLGGLVRTDLDVITRDYNVRLAAGTPMSGIIGRDFFGDGLLIIDYPRRTLSFTRTQSLSRTSPGAIGYERAFRVPVTIGAVATEGNLDSGANIAAVMPKALFDQVSTAPLSTAAEGSLANTKIETQRAIIAGPMRIGDISVSDIEVRVSDRFPELYVGAHILQNYAVLIDQRTKSIALCPPTGDQKSAGTAG